MVRKPYVLIPTVERELAKRTLAQILSTAGMEVGSVISYDPQRRGFTFNANQALGTVLGLENVSHVVFCNEDIVVTQEGWLKRLVEALDEQEDFGLASPGGLCRTQPICYGRPGMREGIQVVRQLPFFCAAIKIEVINRIGRLDDRYAHYGSDSDYCERAREAGYQLIWVQDLYVENKLTPLKTEWKRHDREVFFKQWGW